MIISMSFNEFKKLFKPRRRWSFKKYVEHVDSLSYSYFPGLILLNDRRKDFIELSYKFLSTETDNDGFDEFRSKFLNKFESTLISLGVIKTKRYETPNPIELIISFVKMKQQNVISMTQKELAFFVSSSFNTGFTYNTILGYIKKESGI